MLTRILTMRCRDERRLLEFEVKQIAFDVQDELRLEGILCPGQIHDVYYGTAGNVEKISLRHDKLPNYVANAGFQVPGKVVPHDEAAEQYVENLRIEIEAEKQAQAERGRLEAEAELKNELRETFLRVNSAASADDFERIYPKLRDEHFIGATLSSPSDSIERYIAASYKGTQGCPR